MYMVDDKTIPKTFYILYWSLQGHMPSGAQLSGFQNSP